MQNIKYFSSFKELPQNNSLNTSYLVKTIFKKATFLQTIYGQPDQITGINIIVSSLVQGGDVYVTVDDPTCVKGDIASLNNDPSKFGAIVVLENPVLNLKANGKYHLSCSAIWFMQSSNSKNTK